MQPIVRLAAQCAGPEQDVKLLAKNCKDNSKTDQRFEGPVDFFPAFFSAFNPAYPFIIPESIPLLTYLSM